MEDKLIMNKLGDIKISVYENCSGSCVFYIAPESEQLSNIVDILEDTLKKY